MRVLIDGYNVMFAGGLMPKRLGPDGLRKTRNRFLNDLADALGPLDALETTVVFDATQAPAGAPKETPHKGMRVVYAIDDDDADSRIEQIIAKHSHPKTLTVVSTDRRIRQAASRRKARPQTAEDFWTELDARKRRRHATPPPAGAPPPHPPRVTAEESAYWQREFQDIHDMPEVRDALAPESAILTDEEIARIEREVDGEFR